MIPAKSNPTTRNVRPSSTFVSPVLPRSKTTGSLPLANMLRSRKPASWAGPKNKSWPSTKIWVCRVRDGPSAPGSDALTTEVGLGRVAIVLGLEVSRLARNNADWYRLFDLCSVTDTLVGDDDGVYHPALLNDRLILGLNRPVS